MATYHEVPQEEDAAELTFPKEFENAETLLISEVNILQYTKFHILSSILVGVKLTSILHQ